MANQIWQQLASEKGFEGAIEFLHESAGDTAKKPAVWRIGCLTGGRYPSNRAARAAKGESLELSYFQAGQT